MHAPSPGLDAMRSPMRSPEPTPRPTPALTSSPLPRGSDVAEEQARRLVRLTRRRRLQRPIGAERSHRSRTCCCDPLRAPTWGASGLI